jgi:TetR/AcrR family transcriptional regulator, regulator of cefoperazone and chloramphenicol sensitivity
VQVSSTTPDSEPSARRPYDSPRRREQALETRARIADAARRLFLSRGWAATRVRDVAEEAGVSEPTVYAAYASKAGLAMALVDAVDMSADVPRLLAELEAAGDDPVRQLAAMVAFDRRLFERGGDVIALLRDAGGSEPKLRAAYQEGRGRGDQLRQRVFSGWSSATFRDGVTAHSAADAFAALCNVDVYRVLSEERGWSPDQIERWWHESLVRLLLR